MNRGSIKQILDGATMRDSEAFGGGGGEDIKAFCQSNTEFPLSPKNKVSPITFDKKIDINKQFKFIATIGKGAYGSVFLVENANGKEKKEYAIKVLKYNDHYTNRAEKEEHIKNLTWELQIME